MHARIGLTAASLEPGRPAAIRGCRPTVRETRRADRGRRGRPGNPAGGPRPPAGCPAGHPGAIPAHRGAIRARTGVIPAGPTPRDAIPGWAVVSPAGSGLTGTGGIRVTLPRAAATRPWAAHDCAGCRRRPTRRRPCPGLAIPSRGCGRKPVPSTPRRRAVEAGRGPAARGIPAGAGNPERPAGSWRRARWGSLQGGLGVCLIVASTAIGAIATMATASAPGFLLGAFVVIGTVAAALAVRPGPAG